MPPSNSYWIIPYSNSFNIDNDDSVKIIDLAHFLYLLVVPTTNFVASYSNSNVVNAPRAAFFFFFLNVIRKNKIFGTIHFFPFYLQKSW